nr:hypothetical transcript [Hymenolepis microstoma]
MYDLSTKILLDSLTSVSTSIEHPKVGCAIDSPPRGAPRATYTHTAKRSVIRQLTSNYHDSTVCHIQPLPQYSPYLTFFSTSVSASFTSSLPLSTFCGFDVPLLLSVKPEVN